MEQTSVPVIEERHDPWIWRIAISGMVAIGLTAVTGIVTLSAMGRPVSEGLVGVASAVVGGIGLWLAPSPLQQKK